MCVCDQGLMDHVHSPFGMPWIMSTTKGKEGAEKGEEGTDERKLSSYLSSHGGYVLSGGVE